MTPIIIAGIILAVGAVVEIVVGIFTANILKKREDGLDKRQAILDQREAILGNPQEAPHFVSQSKTPVRVCAERTISFDYVFNKSIGREIVQRSLENHVVSLKGLLLDALYDHIIVKQFNPPESDDVELTAELWILEGGE
jgi:hypothetical protein